jgi:hypothetical protein
VQSPLPKLFSSKVSHILPRTGVFSRRPPYTVKRVVFLLILATTPAAVAADKIEGAFGLKLGDVFEPKTSPIPKGPDGVQFSLNGAYEFTPKERNKDFSDYYVFITPNSHLVCKILAVHKEPAESGNAANCHAFRNALTAILHLKYEGTFDEKSRSDSNIGQGRRSIGTFAPVVVNQTCWLAIFYSDDELTQRASEEREQNRVKAIRESVKSVDATGL